MQTPFGSPAVPLVNVIRHGSLGRQLDRLAPARRRTAPRRARASTWHSGLAASSSSIGCARRRRSATGPRRVQAQAQVLRAQLLGARQHDGADAEARDHREHPLRAVADQRHHDVAAADPVRGQACRPAARAVGSPRRTSTRAARRRVRSSSSASRCARHRFDDVAGEVHAGILPLPRKKRLWSAESAWP